MMKQLLKIKEVMDTTQLSRSTIYRYVELGVFPKPIKLGERSSAWVEEEVQEWIEARIEASRKEVA